MKGRRHVSRRAEWAAPPLPLLGGLVLATAVACGPRAGPDGAPPSPPAAPRTVPLAEYGWDHVGVKLPGLNICATNEDGSLKNPVAPGTYRGLLRNAECEQQKFITMSRVAQALDVDCTFCHVPDPNDPNKALYAEWTERKRRANWMLGTFVQGLRPIDGSRTTCASCHRGRRAEPTPAILGDPRDTGYAQEWMHEVMTSTFVTADGDRLRCKTCHGGMAPGTSGWEREVIRQVHVIDGALRRSAEPEPEAETETEAEAEAATAPETEGRR